MPTREDILAMTPSELSAYIQKQGEELHEAFVQAQRELQPWRDAHDAKYGPPTGPVPVAQHLRNQLSVYHTGSFACPHCGWGLVHKKQGNEHWVECQSQRCVVQGKRFRLPRIVLEHYPDAPPPE